jgi:hypothetical protein
MFYSGADAVKIYMCLYPFPEFDFDLDIVDDLLEGILEFNPENSFIQLTEKGKFQFIIPEGNA